MSSRRDRARQMRLEGMSLKEIAKTVGAAKSSVSGWVRDIELTPEQQDELKRKQHRWGAQNAGAQSNREKHLALRRQYQEHGRAKAQEARPLHMMGCMLYWAEGAKQKSRLYFVNSDVNMLLLFMRFLREELAVSDNEITLYIHCHHEDAIPTVEAYWLGVLGLARAALRKTQVKKGSTTRQNVLEHGVCGISVHRTELVMHIYGAIQEYGGFEQPDWLF